MRAPDLFSPEDFEKLLADNFTAESRDDIYFIFSKNNVVGSEFPVGIYYPNAEYVEFLGRADKNNPLVEYMMDNSLFTPDQFRYVDSGNELRNKRIAEYGLGGFIFGTLLGAYAGYKVGRRMKQKKNVFKTEKQIIQYANDQLKKLEDEKTTMAQGGNIMPKEIVGAKANMDITIDGQYDAFNRAVRYEEGDDIQNKELVEELWYSNQSYAFDFFDKFGNPIDYKGNYMKKGGQVEVNQMTSNFLAGDEVYKIGEDPSKAFGIVKSVGKSKVYVIRDSDRKVVSLPPNKLYRGAQWQQVNNPNSFQSGGSVSDKVKRPFKVRFHLGAGKNFMTWRVENTDTKEVEFIDPDENRLVLYNCRLTNRPTTAKKIYSGEINKQPIAWIECENLEVFNDTEVPVALDQIRYNPRVNIHWHNNSSSNIDGMTFPKLVTYGRSVFVQDGENFYELGGVIYDNNRMENFDSVSTEPFDSLSEMFMNGGEVGMKKVLENAEFEYYWDMEDEDNAYMIRKSDGQQFYGYFPMDSMYNDILSGNFTWVAPEMKYNVEQIIEENSMLQSGGFIQKSMGGSRNPLENNLQLLNDTVAKYIYAKNPHLKAGLKIAIQKMINEIEPEIKALKLEAWQKSSLSSINSAREVIMKKGGRVQSPAEDKFTYVMREYGKGRLHHGTTGEVVTDLDMAVAIAYSEARKIDKNFGRKKMVWGGRIKGATEYTFDNDLGATTTIVITPLKDNKWRVAYEVKQWSDKWKKPIHHSDESFWLPEDEMKKLKVKIMRKRPKVKKY